MDYKYGFDRHNRSVVWVQAGWPGCAAQAMGPAAAGAIWLLLDRRSFGGVQSQVLALATKLRAEKMAVRGGFLKDHGPHPTAAVLAALACAVLPGGWRGLRAPPAAASPGLLHIQGDKARSVIRGRRPTPIVDGRPLNGRNQRNIPVERVCPGVRGFDPSG